MTEVARVTDQDEIRRILEARAAELAQAGRVVADDDQDRVTLVVLILGAERYGIDIDGVREIKPFEEVTPMPATPPFWMGLVNLRGNLFPVLDLARYLGQRTDLGGGGAGEIVVISGQGLTIGLKVDEVPEVITIPRTEIGPSLVEASSDRPHVHAGLTADLLAILDLDALLADSALVVQDEID